MLEIPGDAERPHVNAERTGRTAVPRGSFIICVNKGAAQKPGRAPPSHLP